MALITAKWLFSGTTTGETLARTVRLWTYQARITGTGAVSATVLIEVRNIDGGEWETYGTLTLSGTTTDTDYLPPGDAPWLQHRARCTAISGTGAAVTVVAGGAE